MNKTIQYRQIKKPILLKMTKSLKNKMENGINK